MRPDYAWVVSASAWNRSARELARAAVALEALGDLRGAASAYDRAYGQDPTDPDVRRDRARVLDALAVTAHGMTFRYVPEGPFVMGNDEGEADEAPAHVVELSGFWLAEVPLTWTRWAALSGLGPPPGCKPPEGAARGARDPMNWHIDGKIRLRYSRADGDLRFEGEQPEAYDVMPMVSVTWGAARAFAEGLGDASARYGLPTEAQWEKAARGGLVGCAYPWGDEAPTTARCDYGRFERFSLLPPRSFAPNGYGLFAMAGTVWEWTADGYDALYYGESPRRDPTGPAEAPLRVVRGGSWADCEEACTVSFRMAMNPDRDWRTRVQGAPSPGCPNVGVRIARYAKEAP